MIFKLHVLANVWEYNDVFRSWELNFYKQIIADIKSFQKSRLTFSYFPIFFYKDIIGRCKPNMRPLILNFSASRSMRNTFLFVLHQLPRLWWHIIEYQLSPEKWPLLYYAEGLRMRSVLLNSYWAPSDSLSVESIKVRYYINLSEPKCSNFYWQQFERVSWFSQIRIITTLVDSDLMGYDSHVFM